MTKGEVLATGVGPSITCLVPHDVVTQVRSYGSAAKTPLRRSSSAHVTPFEGSMVQRRICAHPSLKIVAACTTHRSTSTTAVGARAASLANWQTDMHVLSGSVESPLLIIHHRHFPLPTRDFSRSP